MQVENPETFRSDR